MQKNEENASNEVTWNNFRNLLAGEMKSLATEMIQDERRVSKSRGIGLGCVTAVGIVAVICFAYVNHTQTMTIRESEKEWRETVEKNNQKWIDYLSQYDFVSQDGGGINNINTGEQGDLLNGSESQIEEE